MLPSCSSSYFPDDLDTTSLALTVFQPIDEVINSVLDEMEEYINEDGTIQVSSPITTEIFYRLAISSTIGISR